MTTEARKAFEHWFTNGIVGLALTRSGEDYTLMTAQTSWIAWQAATAQATAAERDRCMLVCENMTAGSTRAEISDAIRKGDALEGEQ